MRLFDQRFLCINFFYFFIEWEIPKCDEFCSGLFSGGLYLKNKMIQCFL
jgi:hypothetical protein